MSKQVIQPTADVIPEYTTKQLLDAVMARHNRYPSLVREDIVKFIEDVERFVYEYTEMTTAHDDALLGNDEDGQHGAEVPF